MVTRIASPDGERLDGTEGRDRLTGLGGWDELYGYGGKDVLTGGGGRDIIEGGRGRDIIRDSGSGGSGQANLIDGGAGNDRIIVTALYNRIKGGAGDDRISHEATGPYNFSTFPFTTIEGGRGADTITLINSNATVSYASSPRAVVIDLQSNIVRGGHATGDVFNNVNSIEGTAAADRLTGNDQANALRGGGGDDVLKGHMGDDMLDGQDGDDLLRGGGDDDRLDGGAGADRLFGDDGNDRLTGGAGADRLDGGAGDADEASYGYSTAGGIRVNLATGRGSGGDAEGDRLVGIENVTGTGLDDALIGDARNNTLIAGRGNDVVKGGGGNDYLGGGDGNDRLIGGAGNDLVVGGNGDDVVSGGEGSDTLHGGVGDDVLTGGGGADIFRFKLGYFETSFGDDVITDFSARNSEKIDLSGLADIISFADLMAEHLETDSATGFARITSDFGSILLSGYSVSDFGDGQAVSAADFLF